MGKLSPQKRNLTFVLWAIFGSKFYFLHKRLIGRAKGRLCRQQFKSAQKSGRINEENGFFLLLTGLEHYCVSLV